MSSAVFHQPKILIGKKIIKCRIKSLLNGNCEPITNHGAVA